MNIDQLSIQQFIEIVDALRNGQNNDKNASHSLDIGKSYLIRTVTMMYTGKLVSITDTDLVLEDAAWIADSGRYYNALAEGTLSEVEPYPDGVVVSRAAMVDAAAWAHDLPRTQK